MILNIVVYLMAQTHDLTNFMLLYLHEIYGTVETWHVMCLHFAFEYVKLG